MLNFIEDGDFLKVDTFKENADGSVSWVYNEGAGLPTHSGVIRKGFIRKIQEGGIDKSVNIYDKLIAAKNRGDVVINPVPQSEIDEAAAQAAKSKERTTKLNAFEFKGVMCSVCEDDQNGWESLSSRIKRELERGTDWRPIPFFMENGNHVVLDTLDEWESFVDAGWAARDVIMLARLA